MTESYYKLCLKELASLDGRKRILLHSCCGPCSSQVITFLTKYFDITILYYNPNISPIEEYNKRKEEQIRLSEVFKKLSKKGCYVMLSNHNTALIKKLYKDYNIHIIKAKRNINANGKKRGKVEELIITNY